MKTNVHHSSLTKRGWEVKRLGEIAQINYGYTEKASFEKIGPKFLRITDIQNNNVNWETVPFCKIQKNDLPQYQLNEDDIVFARTGATTGKSFLIKSPPLSVFASYLIRLKIISLSKVNPEFLFYFFQSGDYWDNIKKGLSGSAQGGFNASKLSEILIPFPPFTQQHRIVAILDQAFAAIEKAKTNAEKNLQNAKALFDSYLQNIFESKGEGWEEKKLGDVLKKTETVDPTKDREKEFIYLDVSSVNKETKEIEEATLLIGKDAPSRARKLIRTNDIIFATVRPTHSRVALIKEEYNEQVCSTGYFVLRPKDFLYFKLVFYFLLTYSFNQHMEKLQRGTSYPAVTDNDVKNITISYPKSLVEQTRIVKKLDTLSAETKKLEALYQKKIADLEELKKSILNKAFNGELHPHPNPPPRVRRGGDKILDEEQAC